MNLSFFRRKQQAKSAEQNTKSKASYIAVASTDVGAVRENNEDRILFLTPHNPVLLETKGVLGIVADGMGGHNGGEIASQMAVDLISANYFDEKSNTLDALKKSFQNANSTIFKTAAFEQGTNGMGTTCTAVAITGNDLHLCHIGDSRAYLINEGSIKQLSQDHSYIQYLLEQKILNEQQMINHPDRNILTKSMGTTKKIEPQFKTFKNMLGKEDQVFMCSDGLYEYISDQEIHEMLWNYPFSDVGQEMIKLAKKRGGHDNISTLTIKRKQGGRDVNLKQTQEIL